MDYGINILASFSIVTHGHLQNASNSFSSCFLSLTSLIHHIRILGGIEDTGKPSGAISRISVE